MSADLQTTIETPTVFAPAIRSRAAARAVDQLPEAPVQQVYAPGFALLLSLPTSCIVQMPPAKLNITRLVLCSKFNPADPETSCPMGDKCKFVHADASAATVQHEVHVNYAWRSPDDVTYPRMPAGETLRVAPIPASERVGGAAARLPQTVQDIPSEHILRTQAFGADGNGGRDNLQHCAHFCLSRTCNQGADCQFVHVIHIDVNAKDHQRAPSMKDTRQHKKKQSTDFNTGNTVNLVNSQPSTAPSTPPSPAVAPMSLCDEFELVGGASCGAPAGLLGGAASSSAPAGVAGNLARHSYRHDPYKVKFVPAWGYNRQGYFAVGW